MTFSLRPLCFFFSCFSSYYSLHYFINVFVSAYMYLENRGPVYPILSPQCLEQCLALCWIDGPDIFPQYKKKKKRRRSRRRRRRMHQNPPNSSLSGFTDTALLGPYCTHWEFPLEISQKHRVKVYEDTGIVKQFKGQNFKELEISVWRKKYHLEMMDKLSKLVVMWICERTWRLEISRFLKCCFD